VTDLIPATQMRRVSDFGVLIVGYKRSESLRAILDVCLGVQIKRIYIAIDAPKDSDTESKQREIHRQIEEFRQVFNGDIKILQRERNVGCAASVLSAVDWLFENETYGVVIEDDCIPVPDFFKFCSYAFPIIDDQPNTWLSCGTQLAPASIKETDEQWLLSIYPLTWGWATTSVKWREITKSIRNLKSHNVLSSWSDNSYWNAGALRALKGYTDVWDTLLVLAMLANKKTALLPAESLIRNVGNDENATHTTGSSDWLHRKTGSFITPLKSPLASEKLNRWIRKNIYMISVRHIFTTRISKLRDMCGMNKKLGPLSVRWDRANLDRRTISE
jgi:hypothetical protein